MIDQFFAYLFFYMELELGREKGGGDFEYDGIRTLIFNVLYCMSLRMQAKGI